MAYATEYRSRESGFVKKLVNILSTAFGHVAALFNAIAEAQSRADQIERLQALSDQELAKRGLTRDRIVHHVFRDKLGY